MRHETLIADFPQKCLSGNDRQVRFLQAKNKTPLHFQGRGCTMHKEAVQTRKGKLLLALIAVYRECGDAHQCLQRSMQLHFFPFTQKCSPSSYGFYNEVNFAEELCGNNCS